MKLGSPNLNFLIIAGAAILYISMYFYAVSVTELGQQNIETILCNVSKWYTDKPVVQCLLAAADMVAVYISNCSLSSGSLLLATHYALL